MSIIKTGMNYVAEHPAAVAPPAAVAGMDFVGIPLEQWVYILTILYTLVNLGWLVWKIWRHFRGKDDQPPRD